MFLATIKKRLVYTSLVALRSKAKKVCCNSKWEALRFVAYGALSLL
ncbi:unknown protein [Parachlamydia acanthamoebae UV-7]|uniref:Uncharacterized protein n=2 Tax=Parachlamydia acanthamoebae TaxID=83552 RepID=F8KWW7_PARAV|nr:hypothetical protein DB43_FX00140 [Parachlamydia acanthamoebae]CCB86579.1 unknown protein [Parachlamydia acanthamoebae UV-7]